AFLQNEIVISTEFCTTVRTGHVVNVNGITALRVRAVPDSAAAGSIFPLLFPVVSILSCLKHTAGCNHSSSFKIPFYPESSKKRGTVAGCSNRCSPPAVPVQGSGLSLSYWRPSVQQFSLPGAFNN